MKRKIPFRRAQTLLRLMGACCVGGAVLSTVSCRPKPAPSGAAAPAGSSAGQRAAETDALSRVRFVDDTEAAGLSFIQSDGSCGMRYFVEQVAAGAAVLDANGDGYPDLYFPAPKPIGACKAKYKETPRQRLYLNDGHGHFRLAPNAFRGVETDYGIAAAVGDYDNDGRPDLYVCCFGKNKLFRNRGDGTFEDVTKRAGVEVGGFSTGAVWFDYDGDGRLDLYVLRYCEWDLEHDIPCPGPNGKRDVCEPSTYTPATNKLFHNNRDGTFTDVTAKMNAAPSKRRSLGVAAVDFDGDGWLDLFVSNDLGPNYLLHNNHGKGFEETAMQMGVASGITGAYQANMGVAVGDYDNSGRMSVAVTTFANEPVTLYRNEGFGFTDVSAATGIAKITLQSLNFGAGFFDACNRGILDLIVANGHVSPFADEKQGQGTYKQKNQLMVNDGKGAFLDASGVLPQNDVRVHRGMCFASFRNNGLIDVLVTANNDRPTLLRNDSQAGHWLLVKLVDRHGCCTPVGTRCLAWPDYAAGGKGAGPKPEKLLRSVIGGASYGGDSDFRVHFGLGTATRLKRLEIHWMSGKTQMLENVTADQILSVREPAS